MGVALTSAVTRMMRARARVTPVTRVTRGVPERHLHRQRHTACARSSKRANETVPPPLLRARMGDIGEGGR